MNIEVNNLTTPYRCAVFFVPNMQSIWWQAGCHWLGRCALTNQPATQPTLAGISQANQWALTADPRRYGWHATLKAPFKILPGETITSVVSALRALAKTLPAFDLPALQVSQQDGYLSLRPEGDLSHINRTAASCVMSIHHLAAPLDNADLERRRQAPLTPMQDQLLMAWGYPYVLEAFQFHMSLTGRLEGLSDKVIATWHHAAQTHFENLGVCRFDQLALFIEPERGADFRLIEVVELAA
jgi:hypothetical protein